MNLPEILLCAYALHIVTAAVLFHVAGSSRVLDEEVGRLVVSLLWPISVPILSVLWLCRPRVKVPRARAVRR